MNIVVDTSALIAILRAEADAPDLLEIIGAADEVMISAATLLEASIVTAGKGDETLRLKRLVEQTELVVVPFSAEESLVGEEAYRRFGRGSGHPAKLNFGDCFAYALAKARGLPLLFKGNDFIHTDLKLAWRPEQLAEYP